jgi:hypothetical protein
MSYRYQTRSDADGATIAEVVCPHGTTAGRLQPGETAGVEVLVRLVSRHVVVHDCLCVAAVGQAMARAAAGGGSRR